MTIAALKEYLGMVVQTEKEVNAQEELSNRLALDIRHYHTQIDTLNNKMRTIEKPIKPSRKMTHENERKERIKLFVVSLIGLGISALIFYGINYIFPFLAGLKSPPLLIIVGFLGIFAGIGVLLFILMTIVGLFMLAGPSRKEAIEKDDAIYQNDMWSYNNQCHQYNEIQRENKNRKDQIQQLTTQIAVAEAYRQQVETSLRSSRANLEKMYSYNVVFPKYRNYVMVSSIYEYFCSGRCTTLEGHDGAYNILELEIRLDKIITRLDKILKNLSAIQSNQYTLYCCLQDSNRKMDTLLQEESRMADSLQGLDSQTATMNARLAGLQKSSELSNYLAECNQRELHYMNRMNYLAGHYDNPYGSYAPV